MKKKIVLNVLNVGGLQDKKIYTWSVKIIFIDLKKANLDIEPRSLMSVCILSWTTIRGVDN